MEATSAPPAGLLGGGGAGPSWAPVAGVGGEEAARHGDYVFSVCMKMMLNSWVQWLMPVIPALWEAKAGRSPESEWQEANDFKAQMMTEPHHGRGLDP
nr:putative uncharacterized protein C8orf44 homolog [Macaca nemestrina]